MKKAWKIFFGILEFLLAVLILIPGIFTLLRSAGAIYEVNDVPSGDYDCILVLGAAVRPDGTPSPMLADRLDCGIDLYKAEKCDRLLLSGDHRVDDYNEVGVMLARVTDAGVPGEAVFLDHSGLSTYESLYRAIHMFGAKKLMIVTQHYHLFRAVSIARALGADAVGVAADSRPYAGAVYRECREVLARSKDFYMSLLRIPVAVEPVEIDLDGDGTVTHEKP